MPIMRAPYAILCGLLCLAIAGTACTDRRPAAEVGALPVAPTAYPTGPASAGPGVAGISEDIQALDVQIVDGRFESDVYTMQPRPARLEVTAGDGPYTLRIDGLIDTQPLEADGVTVIGLAPTSPGRFTMRLGGASIDTATLTVRAAGDR